MLLDNTCTLAHIHVLYTCISLKCGARQRTVAHSGKTHLLNSLGDFYTGTLAMSVPMRNTCTHNIIEIYNRAQFKDQVRRLACCALSPIT